MAIIRIQHDKENPFVMLNKKALWDENVSLEATGLWARLLSRPDDWQVSAQELSSSCKIPIRRVWKLLNILIAAGYAHRHQVRKGDGDFHKVEYYVFESKKSEEEIKEMFALVGFAHSAVALNAKRHTTNTDITYTERKEREGVPPTRTPISSTSSKKIERQPHVSTTEEEHIRLSTDFGEPVRDSAYKRLSEWKQNTPKSKWKLHDNLTIRSWVIEAIREEALKKGKPGLDTNGNKAIFDKLKQKFSNHKDIIFGENYIEFNFGQSNHPHVRITDNGFEEQVQNNLRKMGLRL